MAYHSGADHDPYGPRAHGPTGGPTRRSGGVPDGLIVGLLALASSVAVAVWSATGLAGLLRHGAWPEGVSFARTGGAVRSILTAPADIPAAWPQADPATLPTASLVWVVFFAQLTIVFSTVLWLMVRIARWRARRRPPHSPHPHPAPHNPASPDPTTTTATTPAVPAGHRPPDTTPPAPAPPGHDAAEHDPAWPDPAGPDPTTAGTAAPATAMPVGTAGKAGPATPADGTARAESPTPVTAVLRAPGGTVVADPDGTLYEKTARRRAKLGPVHVYDPGHAVEVPVRLRWAPHRGCEDLTTARARAVALLHPVRPREPVFQLDAETAETILRTYLHAAALTGAPFTHVHRWAQGRSGEPAKVLRTHPRAAPGASMELEAALTSHPGRRDAALALLNRALAGLDQLHIRQASTPGRVDTLALDNIANEDGTLYVIGTAAATEPFRHALLSAVTAAGLHRAP